MQGLYLRFLFFKVSTHSRLKAAGFMNLLKMMLLPRFNTQPPEGGWRNRLRLPVRFIVSTHSRLKAAGFPLFLFQFPLQFQHTAA